MQQPITIRPARPGDADGIAAVFLESAEHHARLEPARYRLPDAATVRARYREGRQHPPDTTGVTLVADADGAIVGFVDVRCEPSPDPMHRDVLLCHIVEIAVAGRRRSQGIGGQLLRAAEEWGIEHGAAFAILEHVAANLRAGEFYQRKMGYSIGAITMVKALR
jgi:GNAT superfamily N-acetyltransferase